MAQDTVPDVAIVGGGVVGIATALCLQDAGYSVLLIDRDNPGAGCSAGNAGVMATSFVLPLSSFGHILAAPRMLMDSNAPLSLPWRHVVEYAPWLWRFAGNAMPSKRRHSIDAIKRLNEASLESWKRLLGPEMTSKFLIERGMLDVVSAGQSLDALHANAGLLRSEGVSIDVLSADGVAELEPALKGRVSGGVLHTASAQVTDPFDLSQAMVSRFTAAGGQLLKTQVDGIAAETDCAVIYATGISITARHVVVAAGWWSPTLVADFGLKAPLRAERGYHVMLPNCSGVLNRPVSFHAESFLATPMDGGLRLAGTVELAPPDAPADWRRSDNLTRQVAQYLPDLDRSGQTRWVGARPSFADSLPAIGAVRGAGRVLYAFGHQHLGLTQAAVTAEYIRDIIRGTMPDKIQQFSLERFGALSTFRASAKERAA